MDIFMQGMNGIETAQQLIERNGKISIILCSSSNEYASESYDIGAIRYLLKPISQEKFYRSLDVFFEKYADKDPISYRSMRLEHSISKRNVLWIEAQGKKSIIHTINEAIETMDMSEKINTLRDGIHSELGKLKEDLIDLSNSVSENEKEDSNKVSFNSFIF